MKLKELTPFGYQVKVKLLQLGLSQKEFCMKNDIPLNRFSEILYGTRPGTKYREKIAVILGVGEAA